MNLIPPKLRSWLKGLRSTSPLDPALPRSRQASIDQIDANATTSAAANQSAKDAAAVQQRSPAEEGGEG